MEELFNERAQDRNGWFHRECQLLSAPVGARICVNVGGKLHKIDGMIFVKEENTVEITGVRVAFK